MITKPLWSTSVLTADFQPFNFDDKEGEKLDLSQIHDEWIPNGPTTTHSFFIHDVRNPNQELIGAWRPIATLCIHLTIAPFVKNRMLTSAADGVGESDAAPMLGRCKDRLRLLIVDGCKEDAKFARDASLLMGNRPTGHSGRLDYLPQPNVGVRVISYLPGSLHRKTYSRNSDFPISRILARKWGDFRFPWRF